MSVSESLLLRRASPSEVRGLSLMSLNAMMRDASVKFEDVKV